VCIAESPWTGGRWTRGQVETYLLCFGVVDFVVAAVCCDELGARD